MSDYDNNNRGAIWKNEKRETDKHPHFTGTAMVEGVEYWVSGWKREGDNPKAPALKFSFKRKEAPAAPATKPANDFNDDLPF